MKIFSTRWIFEWTPNLKCLVPIFLCHVRDSLRAPGRVLQQQAYKTKKVTAISVMSIFLPLPPWLKYLRKNIVSFPLQIYVTFLSRAFRLFDRVFVACEFGSSIAFLSSASSALDRGFVACEFGSSIAFLSRASSALRSRFCRVRVRTRDRGGSSIDTGC